MTPYSSLYRVSCKAFVWTLVEASSAIHARIIARKLSNSALEMEGSYDFEVAEITDRDDVPEHWRGAVPWCDPDLANSYDESTCQDVIDHAMVPNHAQRKWLS